MSRLAWNTHAQAGQGAIRLLSSLAEHREALFWALEQANRSIVIVSPFVRASVLDEDAICDRVRRASSNNVAVAILTDEASNTHTEEARRDFNHACERLRRAGAKVIVAKPLQAGYARLHSKLLWVDRKAFFTGSFNWLSAPRYAAGDKVEHTALVDDEGLAQKMIKSAYTSLTSVLPEVAKDRVGAGQQAVTANT